MSRVFLTVLDGTGCGYLPDAEQYGDVGANTCAHVIEKCNPVLPHMAAMGFGNITGTGYTPVETGVGAYGRSAEVSKGKDTTTGHWEISGLKLDKPFPTFPQGFPEDFMRAF